TPSAPFDIPGCPWKRPDAACFYDGYHLSTGVPCNVPVVKLYPNIQVITYSKRPIYTLPYNFSPNFKLHVKRLRLDRKFSTGRRFRRGPLNPDGPKCAHILTCSDIAKNH